jgi:hypothetical protein
VGSQFCFGHQLEGRVGRTFERCVKHEAANANKEISEVGDGKYGIVAMFPAALDALGGKIEEEEIGQRVDDLG